MPRKNKNFLFLDDDRSRQKSVQSVYPAVTIVSSVSECLEVLRTKHWRILSLDHDLEGKAYVNSNSPFCGMEIIRQLVGHRHYIDLIIIHTMNHHVKQKMYDVLKEVKYEVIINTFNVEFYSNLYEMVENFDQIKL